MNSCLVVGGTGLVGKHLITELEASNDFDLVYVLVRKKQFIGTKKTKEIVFDFTEKERLQSLDPVNHVFCCLGTTIKKAGSKEGFRYVDLELPVSFAMWAEQKMVDSYSIVTALGADSSSRIFYNQVKGEVEDEIKKRNIPKIQIFQPSLILGKRTEVRFGEIIWKVLFKCINPLFLGPLKKYRGIRADVIAKGMVNHLKNSQNGISVFESHLINK